MNDQTIVKETLFEIFRKCGYSDYKNMTQRDFEHISGEIEKKSGIVISATTIKRLSNGEFSRLPQIATLNALSNYFEFNTWQEYRASLATREKQGIKKVNAGPPRKRLHFPVQLKWGLLLLSIPIFGYFLLTTKSQPGNFDKAGFSAHKNTSNDIPNTVVFNYDIDLVNADSFFIQQSWDKNRRVRIYKNTHTLTDIYYEPGYHTARLIANDSIIKTVDISIPTDKWFFCANEDKARYTTEYIKTDTFTRNGSLAITPDELRHNKIDVDQEKMYVYCYFPGKLEVNSDNYSLKTRVRMKELRNNFCPYLSLEIYCQRYFMVFKSTPPGCASEAFILLGEKQINGKETDLASIAFNVTRWTDIEVIVKNRHATIKINGKDCFSTSYSNSAALITGMGFLSNGLCEVDKVELMGLDGKTVYKNDFE